MSSFVSAQIAVQVQTSPAFAGFEIALIQKELGDAKKTGSPFVTFIFQAIASPFPIMAAGRFFVIATIGDKEYVCCTLNVQSDSIASPTASEQPASQSPPAA
jgi:hypothetical protein